MGGLGHEPTGGVALLAANRSRRSHSLSFYSHFPIFCSITANDRASCDSAALSLSPCLCLPLSAEEVSRLSHPLNSCSSYFPVNNKIHFAYMIQTVVKQQEKLQTLNNGCQWRRQAFMAQQHILFCCFQKRQNFEKKKKKQLKLDSQEAARDRNVMKSNLPTGADVPSVKINVISCWF